MSLPAPGPAPFLISNPSKPATINPGTWDQIFTAASFSRSDVSPAGTSKDGDVTVIVGPELWGLQFSSATNATYFGPHPSQDALLN